MSTHGLPIDLSQRLRVQADCLHVLTLAPADALPKERMLGLLRHQLGLLQQSVIEHFANEEAGGYLTSVLTERPEAAPRVEALKKQHSVVRDELERLIGHAADGARIRQLSEEIASLVEMFDAHEDAEQALIDEVVGDD